MFLTAEQLQELTGRKRRSAQIEHLRREGIPHTVDADGRPRVIYELLIQHQEGKKKTKSTEPDWSNVA